MLTIGQVAKKAGVRIDTVRYYERQGLLQPLRRRPSGYREFDEEAVRRIHFIKRAQELGFSLAEIGELLQLRVSPGARCADVRDRAGEKLATVEDKLRGLLAIKITLEGLMEACDDERAVGECPILESLDAG